MRKSLAMIGLPILLGGCGLPPAVTVASWAADGLSYIVSGKSVTDHAISEVAEQDCALFRIVQGREVCEDFELDDSNGFVLTAASFEGGTTLQSTEIASAQTPSDPLPVPQEIAGFVEGFGPDTIAVTSVAPTASFVPAKVSRQVAPAARTLARFATANPKPRPAYQTTPVYQLASLKADPQGDVIPAPMHVVSVIGSFKYLDNARGLAKQQTGLNAQVRRVQTNGKTWHRVVVSAPLEDVQRAGFEDAWILKVCASGDVSETCGTITQASAQSDFVQVARAN
ncbi:MAG: hypothetical protein HOJ90_05785 [Alphaproteobacteria bacterium]|jgi:hypothetical protein|nr:hypothetical protein [Alphaproteobacteria bacterium]